MKNSDWMNEKYEAIVEELSNVQKMEYSKLKTEVIDELGLSEGRHDVLVMNALDELEEKGVVNAEGDSEGYQDTVYVLDREFRIEMSSEEKEPEEGVKYLLNGGSYRKEIGN